jgi:hypothetical protein
VSTSAEPPDFDGTFSETDEPGGPPAEFDFSEEAGSAESPEAGLEEQESSGISEFSFSDDEETAEQELPGGFDFSDEADEGGSFTFDDAEADSTSTAAEEYAVPGEFSFDEEEPFGEGAAAWSDTTTAEEGSFDFDEPRFDTEGSQTGETASTAGGELQFGEIDFASNSDQSAETSLQGGDDFSKSTLAKQEEPEPFSQRQQSPPPPSRHYDDEGPPLSAPPTPKKSSLSRILVLLVLLLIVLGGAAGYLFMQEGSLNLNTVAQYLPFLQDYIGETPVASPGDRIGINISGSSYVNGQSGQMLVIQGAAVNNHPSTRSAITIKGILLDAKGKALLQQTVFCGNKLDETTLKSMPFAAIEEAMNNQFGDSLSNMNVAAGASIPFTIVFRNLPAGIANINVEVVDSKPGAG